MIRQTYIYICRKKIPLGKGYFTLAHHTLAPPHGKSIYSQVHSLTEMRAHMHTLRMDSVVYNTIDDIQYTDVDMRRPSIRRGLCTGSVIITRKCTS